MDQVKRDQALNKAEFHERLRKWLERGEGKIGPENVDGRTNWVYVREESNLFALHADTQRQAVQDYLQMVALSSGDLGWKIAPSQRGKMTAVTHSVRYKPFYLYAVDIDSPDR